MSVAIRAITRLQDADDAPSLDAGQDGYALTWDNASGAFVVTALFAGGLLATGATTGATSQAQAFTNGVVTPYDAPAADGVAAWQVRKANKTTAVLNVDTTNSRVGIGTAAPDVALHVAGDVSGTSGFPSVRITNASTGTGYANIALFAKSYVQVYFGSNLDGFIGQFTYDVSGKIMAFHNALSNSALVFAVGTNNYETSECMRIMSTGHVGIGTTNPGTLLHGLLTSAATNAATNVLTIGHDTSGTAAAGFGAGQLFTLESSTTAAQSAARIQALWYEATHATRKADLVLTAYDTAEREGLRIRGAGSAPAIGFLGATPAARIAHVADPAGGATVDAEARSAINSILATLETFGFHATS